MTKDVVLNIASLLPESLWNSEDCLLPYYHMVSDEVVPHVSPLYSFRSIKTFSADIDWLLKKRRPLSLDEFVTTLLNTGRPPKRAFLLTFDDGFREMYDVVAPLLRAKGVPAVFFLTSKTTENIALCHHQKIALLLHHRQKAMNRFPDSEVRRLLSADGINGANTIEALKAISWSNRTVLDILGTVCDFDFDAYARERRPFLDGEQVEALLRNGFDIGAHSIDHPRYADISVDEQLRQTRESIKYLANRFALRRRAFAFPHTDRGVNSSFFTQATKENLFEISFGTSSPQPGHDPFNIQRFSMEKTTLPISKIIIHQRLREMKYKLFGAKQNGRRGNSAY